MSTATYIATAVQGHCRRKRCPPPASRSWAVRNCARQSRYRKPSAQSGPPCRSSGAAHFPTVCPDAALNAAYVDFAVRGQGEHALWNCCDALHVSAANRCNQFRACPGAEATRSCTTRIGNSPPPASNRMLPYDKLANPRQYLRQHISRPAHCWLSGRVGLPISLYVLRCRDDVSRQDGAAAGRNACSRICASCRINLG